MWSGIACKRFKQEIQLRKHPIMKSAYNCLTFKM